MTREDTAVREGLSVPAGLLLRSLMIQGSWNYRTLIGTGFAFALLPVLRVRFAGDPQGLRRALRRHAGLFNSHPYLAPMALGAVARLEVEGEDPEVIERFKTAVRGSLGSLGDRLVWAGWRPVCLLVALTLFAAGVPWWLSGATFLATYNAGHIGLRLWSYRMGIENGVRVGEKLRLSLLVPAQRLLTTVGPFLVGAALPLAAAGGLVHAHLALPWALAGGAIALLGARLGPVLRFPLIGMLVLLAGIGVLMGIVE